MDSSDSSVSATPAEPSKAPFSFHFANTLMQYMGLVPIGSTIDNTITLLHCSPTLLLWFDFNTLILVEATKATFCNSFPNEVHVVKAAVKGLCALWGDFTTTMGGNSMGDEGVRAKYVQTQWK